MSESGDWSAQAADTIESVVTSIRDKTTVPLTTVARGIVYGIVAGVMGGAALLLLVIALIRVLDVYIPGNVWTVYAVIGGLFTVGGLLLWRLRRPKTKD
ncbi:MAG TPA: hypothetical protein VFA83_05415 [Acidimicrobiales bacterium]|nr:hypothetical protein [Acidimicrobiales bacterium]